MSEQHSENDAAECDCGHVLVAHEVVIREGKAWVATEADTLDMFPPGAVDQAIAEDRIWLYCGPCEDGCHRTTLTVHSRGPGRAS